MTATGGERANEQPDVGRTESRLLPQWRRFAGLGQVFAELHAKWQRRRFTHRGKVQGISPSQRTRMGRPQARSEVMLSRLKELWIFYATFMICLFGAWRNGYTWDEVAKEV